MKPDMPRKFQLFDQILALFPPGRLVDLGAGHGWFPPGPPMRDGK